MKRKKIMEINLQAINSSNFNFSTACNLSGAKKMKNLT